MAQSGQASGRGYRAAGRTRALGSNARKLDAVIHMGAISDTTATDGDLVMENNFRTVAAAARLVHGNPHALYLCLVGGDLWRRQPWFRRRLVT